MTLKGLESLFMFKEEFEALYPDSKPISVYASILGNEYFFQSELAEEVKRAFEFAKELGHFGWLTVDVEKDKSYIWHGNFWEEIG